MADKIYRHQPIKKDLSVKNIIIMAVSVLILIVAPIVIVLMIKNSGYQPPKHEENAKRGMPTVEDSYMYSTLKTDYGYKFYMAANLYQQENGTLNIYFTNYKTNSDLLMVEVKKQEDEQILYSSGFLYPGEYVDTLKKASNFENKDYKATVSIYAFDRETFESKGTTYLKMELHGW